MGTMPTPLSAQQLKQNAQQQLHRYQQQASLTQMQHLPQLQARAHLASAIQNLPKQAQQELQRRLQQASSAAGTAPQQPQPPQQPPPTHLQQPAQPQTRTTPPKAHVFLETP